MTPEGIPIDWAIYTMEIHGVPTIPWNSQFDPISSWLMNEMPWNTNQRSMNMQQIGMNTYYTISINFLVTYHFCSVFLLSGAATDFFYSPLDGLIYDKRWEL